MTRWQMIRNPKGLCSNHVGPGTNGADYRSWRENMTGKMTEDLPAYGLKKGDEVRVVSTNKKLGRKTIRWMTGQMEHTAIVDAWRVQETMEGWQ